MLEAAHRQSPDRINFTLRDHSPTQHSPKSESGESRDLKFGISAILGGASDPVCVKNGKLEKKHCFYVSKNVKVLL